MGIHRHLKPNHIRKKYKILGKEVGPRLNYSKYLQNISDSEFLIQLLG